MDVLQLARREIFQRNENMDIEEEPEDGEITSDCEQVPTDEKSKRYDLFGDTSLKVPKNELDELYTSLGIDQDNERHFKFNTIHLKNTDKMNTKDILNFFSGFNDLDVIWFEKNTCNVIFPDEVLPARALLYLSTEITNQHKKMETKPDLKALHEVPENKIDFHALNFELPKGLWRKAVDSVKSPNLIMRYAKLDDETLKCENPWQGLAHKWGKVEKDFQRRKLPTHFSDLRQSINHVKNSRFVDNFLHCASELKKNRKRDFSLIEKNTYVISSGSESSEDEEPKRKLPTMRADIEEQQIAMRRFEKVASKQDLRERLPKNRRKENEFKELTMCVKQDVKKSDSESDLELDNGQLLQIEINNDEYFKKKKKKKSWSSSTSDSESSSSESSSVSD